jgi:hypothetical protein
LDTTTKTPLPGPTVTVTASDTALLANETSTLTFELSEAPAGTTAFTEDDISITTGAGALSDFTSVSSTKYTALFTPTADSTTDAEISIAKGAFVGADGVDSVEGDLTLDIDTTVPAAAVKPSISGDAAINASEFGAAISVTVTITATGAVVGDKVELLLDGESFTTAITKTITQTHVDAGTLTMLIPAEGLGGDGSKVITSRVTDAAGNVGAESASLTLSVDTGAAPKLTSLLISDPDTALTNSDSLVFKATFNEKVVDVDPTDFAVEGTTAAVTVKAASDAGKIWNVTLTGGDLADLDGDVTLSFKTTQDITDAGGNALVLPDATWVGESGHTYGLFKTAKTWSDASDYAEATGGYLVKVDSASENTELFTKLQALLTSDGGTAFDTYAATATDGGEAKYVWLGANDATNEGTWTWVDGTSLSTDREEWGSGAMHPDGGSEPDDFGSGQDYLALGLQNWPTTAEAGAGYGDAGSWNDIKGTNELYFVAEYDNLLMSTFTLDNTAPTKATSLTISDSKVSEAEEAAGVTVTVGLSNSGVAAGDIIEIKLANQSFDTPVTHTVTADDLTAEEATVTIPTGSLGDDGTKSLTAVISDAAGNDSTASSALTVTLDTAAPTAPSVPTVASGENTLVNATEKAAGVAVNVSTAGLNAGAVLDLRVDGTSVSTHTLTTSDLTKSNYEFTLDAEAIGTDGTKSVTAIATDAAGNSSLASSALSLTVDTVAPVLSSLKFVEQTSTGLIYKATFANQVTGVGIADFSVTGTTASVTNVEAASEAGKVYNITVSGGDLKEIAEDTSVTLGFAEDADIKDLAGNAFDDLDRTVSFAVDYSPPNAASVKPSVTSGDSYINAAEEAAGFKITASLADTEAAAGDTLELTIGGASFSPALTRELTAGDIETGSYDFTLPAGFLGDAEDGTVNFRSVVTDAAGNEGDPSAALAMTYDTAAPSAPSGVTATATAVDSTISAAEEVKGFDVKVTLANDAAVGNVVELLLGGSSFDTPLTKTLTQTHKDQGFVNITVASGALGDDGAKSITATVTDAAGNASDANSTPLTFTLSTGEAPKVTYSATQFYEKLANNGEIQNTLTLTLSGGIEFNSNVADGEAFEQTATYSVTGLNSRLDHTLTKISSTTAELKLTGDVSDAATDHTFNIMLGDGVLDSAKASTVEGFSTDIFVNVSGSSEPISASGGVTSGTDSGDIIYSASNAESPIIKGLAGNDTIDISNGGASENGSARITLGDISYGTDYVVGFKGGEVSAGGDVLDLSGIALIDSIATGLTTSGDFDANNVFIFSSAKVSIDDAAAAIAADSDVVATEGYIVIKDEDNNGITTVYHSTNLAGNGTETALVQLSGLAIGTLIGANFGLEEPIV